MYQQRAELTSFTLNHLDEEALACQAEPNTISDPSELAGLPTSLIHAVLLRQADTAVQNRRLITPFRPLKSGRAGVCHTSRNELTVDRAWNEALHAAEVPINFTEPGDETFTIRNTMPYDMYDWYYDSRVREASKRWSPSAALKLGIGHAALMATGIGDIHNLLKAHYRALQVAFPERTDRINFRHSLFMTAMVSQTIRQAKIVDFEADSYQKGHKPTLNRYELLSADGIIPLRYDEIVNCFKPAVSELLAESEL